jgi:hypothetical protein
LEEGVEMIRVLSVLALLLVASCGADGEPTPPPPPGLTVSGEVTVGVSGSL